MKGDLITTHTDRLRHMKKCRKWDRAWKQEHGGNLPSEQHYENVGDIASTNNWMYHHFKGYCVFYANTPDWIVGIAIRRCWISERGELMLCTNCNNIDEGGCPICCPEAYAGGAV